MGDFERYLERYCKKHEISPEEAKEHYLVKEVKVYYEERGDVENGNQIISSSITGSC